MTDEMVSRVIGCIAASQKVPPEKVTLESSFEDLGIDSLDGVNILFALETEFNISIPDQGVLSMKNVREVIEALEKVLPAGGAAPPSVTSPS
ncbi:MAG TPA: phosphopantetheine-binding protein [Spirochaetia bacterium]|nr:phosphopantetheine-binding protein [Spirochaetia bacterium]